MEESIKNDFLEFYGEHNISPVSQDISDISIHYKRREKLYRQLGMPILLFKDREMLEVGPGGGYNSLAFFNWGCAHLDLVEANPSGIADMKRLFDLQEVNKEKYTIIESRIEEFSTEKKYDIVIAESFLQNLNNQQEVIDKLKKLVKMNGIIVVTTSDETSFYIEQLKRLIANAMVANIDNYDEKVKCLVKVFEPQLKTLRGVSRSAECWVQDQLLNPVAVNDTSLSLIEAIEMFGSDCDVLSTAPRMFHDYSWYKDIWFNEKDDYSKQFCKDGVNLILANMENELHMDLKGEELKKTICDQKKYASAFEKEFDYQYIDKIIEGNLSIQALLKGQSDRLDKILEEISLALHDVIENGVEDFSFEKYPEFFRAFGRTQQYISFIKK